MGLNPKSGRKANRGLADMSGDTDAEVYKPPPEDQCDVYETPIDVDDDGRIRFHLVQHVHLNKAVHFKVAIQVRENSLADWEDAVRIDTTHGTVHEHRFRPDGTETRTELEAIPIGGQAPAFVSEWFKKARQMCFDSWPNYVKGWLE